MKKKILSLFLAAQLIGTLPLFAGGKIQDADVKSLTDLLSAGGTKSQLINDTKIYVTGNGINDQLSNAIINGQLGGSGGSGSGIELLPNPGFESGGVTSGWSTSGGTANVVTAGSHLLFGKATAAWTASASSQTFGSGPLTISGLAGGNCSAQIYYLYAGTNGDYTFRVLDGSSNVLASQSLNAQSIAVPPVQITFPCGSATTNTLNWQLVSNVSSPSAIYFDNAHLGSLGTYQISQAVMVGAAHYPVQSGCQVQTSTTSFTPFSTSGSCTANLIVDHNDGPGTIQTTSVLNPTQFTVNNLPPGNYLVQIGFGGFSSSQSGRSSWTIGDGTSLSGSYSMQNPTGVDIVAGTVLSGYFSYTTSGNRTFNLQASSTSGINVVANDADNQTVSFAIFRYPTTNETAYRPDQIPSSWNGMHGANCSWSSTNTTIADFPATATCTFTEKSNTNFGTVTSYKSGANFLPGIVFTPPKLGRYFVCAVAKGNVAGGSGSNNAFFDLSDTAGSPTIIASGLLFNGISGSGGVGASLSLCGEYDVSSLNPVTLRIRGAAGATETAAMNVINGSDTGPVITWTIFDMSTPVSAPLLVGSITSNSSGIERMERATVTANCTSSPCTIADQSGSWITSITRSSLGQYTVNIAAGMFSANPICVTSGDAVVGGTTVVNNTTNSPTSVGVSVWATSTSALIDLPFRIMCMGQR